MSESAFAVGGWPAVISALLIGLAVIAWLPARLGPWFSARLLLMWMLWCGLTPIMPWHIDLPLMLGYMIAMELLWRALRQGLLRERERGGK